MKKNCRSKKQKPNFSLQNENENKYGIYLVKTHKSHKSNSYNLTCDNSNNKPSMLNNNKNIKWEAI